MNKQMTITELTKRQAQLVKAQERLDKVQATIDKIFTTLMLTGMVGIITLALMVRG